MFYNTNSEVGQELRTSKEKAKIQENRILSFFQTSLSKSFTPEESWNAIWPINDRSKPPITSVRRAISDLGNTKNDPNKKAKLYKTGEMRMGLYGKPVHCWKAVNPNLVKTDLYT